MFPDRRRNLARLRTREHPDPRGEAAPRGEAQFSARLSGSSILLFQSPRQCQVLLAYSALKLCTKIVYTRLLAAVLLHSKTPVCSFICHASERPERRLALTRDGASAPRRRSWTARPSLRSRLREAARPPTPSPRSRGWPSHLHVAAAGQGRHP